MHDTVVAAVQQGTGYHRQCSSCITHGQHLANRPAETVLVRQLRLTQVTLSIDPELVVRLCTSERQEIPLDLTEPDAVDCIRTPIATTAHAHDQSTTA